MKCLVTGGSGFIGQHIVKELASQGHRVVSFDVVKPDFALPENVEYVEGDIRYFGLLHDAGHGVEEIYNVASLLGTSELMFDSSRATDVNVGGMLNVLEVAKQLGIPRVFYPTKPNDWLNTYSITKFAAEQFCKMYALNFGVRVVSLKWFNAYGRHQKLYPVRKAVPMFIAQALRGRPVEVWGDGSQTMDLIHVEDIAKIAIAALRNENLPVDKVCDVGSGHAITVKELANMIIDLTGSDSVIVNHPMRLGEPIKSDIRADVTALREFVPLQLRDLGEGMADTVASYMDIPEGEINKALRYYDLKTRRIVAGSHA